MYISIKGGAFHMPEQELTIVPVTLHRNNENTIAANPAVPSSNPTCTIKSGNVETGGEAITHNIMTTGIGVGATTTTTGVLTIAATVALGSNPVGWAAVGIAAVGTAVGVGAASVFNYAYDHNFLGLQDGLDWTGQQIDKGWNWTGEKISDGWNWAGDQLDNVGEALGSGLDAINPFSW
jgi:hypothetical protein